MLSVSPPTHPTPAPFLIISIKKKAFSSVNEKESIFKEYETPFFSDSQTPKSSLLARPTRSFPIQPCSLHPLFPSLSPGCCCTCRTVPGPSGFCDLATWRVSHSAWNVTHPLFLSFALPCSWGRPPVTPSTAWSEMPPNSQPSMETCPHSGPQRLSSVSILFLSNCAVKCPPSCLFPPLDVMFHEVLDSIVLTSVSPHVTQYPARD